MNFEKNSRSARSDSAASSDPLTLDALIKAAGDFFDRSLTQPKTRQLYPILRLAEQKPKWKDSWIQAMGNPLLKAISLEKDIPSQRIAVRRQTTRLVNLMIAQEDYLKRKKAARQAITKTIQPSMSVDEHTKHAYESHLFATFGCKFLRGLSRGTFSDGRDNDWYAAYAYLVRRYYRLYHDHIVAEALGIDHDRAEETTIVVRKMRQLQDDVLAGLNFSFSPKALEAEIRSALSRRKT